MKTFGMFRCYFNRHAAAPLVWCIALIGVDQNPNWEIAVRGVGFDGVRVTTVYHPKAIADDEDGRPSSWLEVQGELEILADGYAVIRAELATS